jgi:hypothetical protein
MAVTLFIILIFLISAIRNKSSKRKNTKALNTIGYYLMQTETWSPISRDEYRLVVNTDIIKEPTMIPLYGKAGRDILSGRARVDVIYV